MKVEKADKLIAPCGHYCGWCPYHYRKGTETGHLKCPGCWEMERGECEIRDCAQDRSLSLCTFCPEFPCSKLYDLYSKMNLFFDNIRKDFPQGVRQEEPKQGGESHDSG